MFIKCLCDIIKNCRKAFEEKCNKSRSRIDELVEQYLVNKNKNGASWDVNNMDSEVEVTSCSKDKGNICVLEGALL